MKDEFVDPHRRSDDPVIITTRDIYDLALGTKTTVDALMQGQQQQLSNHTDHETRLRLLETRYFGIVGALGLGGITLIGTLVLLAFQIVRNP